MASANIQDKPGAEKSATQQTRDTSNDTDNKHTDSRDHKQKTWTVMVYLAADNNLANFGIESLKQMKAVADPAINIVAEFDVGPMVPTARYSFDGAGGKNSYGSIEEDEIEQGPRINAGDPRNLSNFITWAQNNFPADRYFLIIWGHGSGIDDTFPRTPDDAAEAMDFDESFVPRHRLLSLGNTPAADPRGKSLAFVDHPSSYLTNQGLRSALETSNGMQRSGKKLDIIGLDACNMGLIELGYELRNVADYMISSQDNIPDASWPYDRLLKKLVDDPNLSPEQLAKSTTETYVYAYRDYVNQPVTLSVLDLKNLSIVSNEFKTVIDDVLRKSFLKTQMYKALVQARSRVRSFYTHEVNPPDSYTYNLYVDLVHFLELVRMSVDGKEKHLLDSAIEAIKGIVSPESSWNEADCNGMSIYFPLHPRQRFAQLYSNLAFARDTGWMAFLEDLAAYSPFLPEQIKVLRSETGNGNNGMDVKGNPNNGTKGNPSNGPKRGSDIQAGNAANANGCSDCLTMRICR